MLILPIILPILFARVSAIDLQVTVKNGVIEGRETYDRQANLYYSFRGIPFAKPPVGALKFRPSEDMDPWPGVLKAYNYAPECPQPTTPERQSEDCLYLNVFVSNPKDPSPKAVMFYIHGGGYVEGVSSSYAVGPDFLMPHNIILVTANYRLSVLGFVSFDDPTLGVFGNDGFKDQVRAMRWVNENIRAFGGDPDTITLVGNSAGSECVHLHLLAPMSKGLYKRAILQSGVSTYLAKPLLTSRQLAEVMNERLYNGTWCVESDWDALQLLNASDPWKMVDVLLTLSPLGYGFTTPVIEKPQSPNPVLTVHPMELISDELFNDVPVMCGYNNREGLAQYSNTLQYFSSTNSTNQNTSGYHMDLTKSNIFYYFIFGLNNLTTNDFDMFLNEVLLKYENSNPIPTVDDYFDVATDLMTLLPLRDTIQMQWSRAKSPTYLYRFNYDTDLNYLKAKKPILKQFRGAAHADELGYLFRSHFSPEHLETFEDRAIDVMTTLWTNFVKTGDPNSPIQVDVNWLPVFVNDEFNSLNIDVNMTSGKGGFVEQVRLDRWLEWRRNSILSRETSFNGFFQKLLAKK